MTVRKGERAKEKKTHLRALGTGFDVESARKRLEIVELNLALLLVQQAVQEEWLGFARLRKFRR